MSSERCLDDGVALLPVTLTVKTNDDRNFVGTAYRCPYCKKYCTNESMVGREVVALAIANEREEVYSLKNIREISG